MLKLALSNFTRHLMQPKLLGLKTAISLIVAIPQGRYPVGQGGRSF